MAYTTPTILHNDPSTDGIGRRHLQVQFTGNAGEPIFNTEFDVSSKADAKAQVIAKMAQLNAALAVTPTADATMASGQVIDLTPDAAPGISTDDQWVLDAQRLTRAKALIDAITAGGVTPANAMTNQFGILAGQVNSGYNATRGGKL